MQDNLVKSISHILLWFWPCAIHLWLSKDNIRHCKSHVCHVTFASTPAKKRKLLWCTVYFLIQLQFTGWYNHRSKSVLYFSHVETVEIWVIWNVTLEFVTEKLMQLWWNAAGHVPGHFYFLSSHDTVWLISTQNPSCVAMSNMWFNSFDANWCDVDVCRDPQNVSTSIVTQHSCLKVVDAKCGSAILKFTSHGLREKLRDNERTT